MVCRAVHADIVAVLEERDTIAFVGELTTDWAAASGGDEGKSPKRSSGVDTSCRYCRRD